MATSYASQSLPLYTIPSTPNFSSVVPPGDQGYDIRAARLSSERRAAALKLANGILSNERQRVIFFANELKVDIGLSGATGQGRRTRDFYPHNIVMPVYTVEGQCLDQWDYATLVEFIHESQQNLVGNSTNAGNLLQLDITSQGIPTRRAIMKGVHKPVQAQGLIESIERKHQKGKYAPTFTLNFVISESFEGIYKGLTSSAHTQESWWQILQGEVAYSQAPRPKTAKNTVPTSTPSPTPTSSPGIVFEPISPLPGGHGFGEGLEEGEG